MVPDQDLKGVQRILLRTVLSRLPQHEANHCRKGRSVLTNARTHVGNSYLSAYDVANAFPSVKPQRVGAALRQQGIPLSLIRPITSLCTFRNELPQGAPTSSTLLNAVLLRLDHDLGRASAKHGLTYTRYVDDIFVSARRPVLFFRRAILRAVSETGLHLAHDKTRHWTPGRRATVTGLVLAARPSLEPSYIRAIRDLVCGVSDGAFTLVAADISRLRGHVAWINAVHPRIGTRLLKLIGARVTTH